MLRLFKNIWRIIGGVWGVFTVILFSAAIFMLHHPVIEKLDGKMFAIDAQFVAKPDKVDEIVVIKLPRVTIDNTTHTDNRLLIIILNEIPKRSPLAIALVFNVSENTHRNSNNASEYFDVLDKAIKKLPKTKRKEFIKNNNFSSMRLFSDSVLIKSVKHKKLFIAQQKSDIETLQFNKKLALGVSNLKVSEPGLLLKFNNQVLPVLPNFSKSKLLNLSYNNLPVESEVTDTAYRSLFWSVNHTLLPDMLTLLYAKLLGGSMPVWEKGKGLKFDNDFRATDWVGRVLPRSSSFTGIKADYEEIPYIDVLNHKVSKRLKNKVVIIGYDNDLVVEDLALSLVSLYTGSVYYSPVWTDVLVIVLLFTILIYSLFLLPKMQNGVSLLLSLFVLFALLVGQMGLLLVQSVWAPMTMVVLFLIGSHALSFLRRKFARRFESLEKQVFEAFWMLGVYQYEQGEYDQSFASLQKCPTTDPMLEQMYRIGQAYEKRRQYNKALDLYRELNSRRPGYKSADKRIKSLVQLEESQTTGINFTSAKTLIVT
ncbi:MAG: tetratricopeptide repeat protein, partial [Gammaproteobacteria bacterium]|nr:tetratricopeptide repeat protein [Gammaproteobacteria bacterium]